MTPTLLLAILLLLLLLSCGSDSVSPLLLLLRPRLDEVDLSSRDRESERDDEEDEDDDEDEAAEDDAEEQLVELICERLDDARLDGPFFTVDGFFALALASPICVGALTIERATSVGSL